MGSGRVVDRRSYRLVPFDGGILTIDWLGRLRRAVRLQKVSGGADDQQWMHQTGELTVGGCLALGGFGG